LLVYPIFALKLFKLPATPARFGAGRFARFGAGGLALRSLAHSLKGMPHQILPIKGMINPLDVAAILFTSVKGKWMKYYFKTNW
jgi:hypothetical protein